MGHPVVHVACTRYPGGLSYGARGGRPGSPRASLLAGDLPEAASSVQPSRRGAETFSARLTSHPAVRSACSCRAKSRSGVATNPYVQSAMDMLLSRKSLDVGTVADQSALNNLLETPQLSHPPCAMRVDLTKTARRERQWAGPQRGTGSVADTPVLRRWMAVPAG